MSLSVNGTNTNNPFAYLQSLWQQTPTSSGAQGQSDPLASLLAGLDQQGTGGTSSAAGTGSSSSTAGVLGSTPQFNSQVLQVLMALQAGGENSTGLASQLGNTIDADDQTAGQQGQATAQSQTGQHHHHFHMGNAQANAANAQAQDLLSAADDGAASQTVANANGSSTTTITYADGSSVAMTTAAPSSSDSASGNSSSSTGSTIASNNLIEQLIQMQAQLVNSASTQGVVTA